jgi:hypothetical protein
MHTLAALAFAAAPGEALMTERAVKIWEGETMNSSLDGANPFAHLLPLDNSKPVRERCVLALAQLLRLRLVTVSNVNQSRLVGT